MPPATSDSIPKLDIAKPHILEEPPIRRQNSIAMPQPFRRSGLIPVLSGAVGRRIRDGVVPNSNAYGSTVSSVTSHQTPAAWRPTPNSCIPQRSSRGVTSRSSHGLARPSPAQPCQRRAASPSRYAKRAPGASCARERSVRPDGHAAECEEHDHRPDKCGVDAGLPNDRRRRGGELPFGKPRRPQPRQHQNVAAGVQRQSRQNRVGCRGQPAVRGRYTDVVRQHHEHRRRVVRVMDEPE